MHAKGLAGIALLWQARGKAEVMWNQAAPQYEKLRAQVQQEIARLRVMFEQVLCRPEPIARLAGPL